MALSLRDVAARAFAPARPRCPVRRGSVEAGTVEARFFAVPGKGETDRLLAMARAALDAGRRLRREVRSEPRELSAPERAIAALTAGAVRVFEEICTLARLNAGKVFPSYDHLAKATALGRATVARALNLLEAAGFLQRQRRFCRGVDGEARYRQTSNIYRALLPAALLRLLPRWFQAVPLPDDVGQHQAERGADHVSMLATLTCRELAEASVGGELGAMLARLGAAVDRAECESHFHPEPLSKSIDRGSSDVDRTGRRIILNDGSKSADGYKRQTPKQKRGSPGVAGAMLSGVTARKCALRTPGPNEQRTTR
ncbi:helix-turn-helix domain-containing protein, partial [Sphingomonas sp. Leaf25]|uniref:helix-turn-helix domain-containing protein n=1 Tax=Sphingomonas sp. Leaf25 TaxID=1735692 RepID=UPI000A68282A